MNISANWFEWLTLDYKDNPFILFGTAHLRALFVVSLFIIYLAWRRDLLTPKARVRWRYSIAIVILLNDLARQLWYLSNGTWSIKIMLPLHLCSLMAYITAYMLFTKDYRAYEFMYFVGIAGGAQALLTPPLGQYGFPHFLFWQTFIWHGLIVIGAIYMTFTEGYLPTRQSLVKVIVYLNVLMIIVGLINPLLDSNYMFLAYKPIEPSALDLLGPWPLYIAQMEIVGLILCGLLFLPFEIRNRQKARAD